MNNLNNFHSPPKKILIIRLQAMGDVVITLPYIKSLKENLPHSTKIHFLTREETQEVPQKLTLFNKIFSIKGGRSTKKQWFWVILMLPKLLLENYEIIADLQNNRLSRFITKFLAFFGNIKNTVFFDKYSPNPAGERNKNTLQKLQIADIQFSKIISPQPQLPKHYASFQLLGSLQNNLTVILNPAGLFENRNWHIENYLSFAKIWLKKYPKTTFLLLGIGKITEKAKFLEDNLNENLQENAVKNCINLVNKTTTFEAFALVGKADFVLSEDSGLMHFAWVQDVPLLAVFGATRSDWTKPLGQNSAYLDSSDMPCGNCMQEKCHKTENSNKNLNECMTRYTPEFIFEKADEIFMKSIHQKI